MEAECPLAPGRLRRADGIRSSDKTLSERSTSTVCVVVCCALSVCVCNSKLLSPLLQQPLSVCAVVRRERSFARSTVFEAAALMIKFVLYFLVAVVV